MELKTNENVRKFGRENSISMVGLVKDHYSLLYELFRDVINTAMSFIICDSIIKLIRVLNVE